MKKTATTIVFMGFIGFLCAQSPTDLKAACSTSGQGKIGVFTISYTIGEMVLVDTWKNNNLIISQGILQPVVDTFNNVPGYFSPGEITVYPNPADNFFTVQLGLLEKGKINFQLFDMSGKLLQSVDVNYIGFTSQTFNISGYANSLYMLKAVFTGVSGTIKKQTYNIVRISK